jgi:septum formation protein
MRQAAPIVLASASPRRAELLTSAGIQCVVAPSSITEQVGPGEAPGDYVLRLARTKVRDVAKTIAARFFLGADTVVVVDGEVLGKPRDDADAGRMLKRLSGRVHEVMTGYEVYDKENNRGSGEVVTTRVEFRPVSAEEIRAYVATGCPLDKAGAYAIQEGAAYMVRRVEGSYTNVVGLPLCEVVETLLRMGVVSVE